MTNDFWAALTPSHISSDVTPYTIIYSSAATQRYTLVGLINTRIFVRRALLHVLTYAWWAVVQVHSLFVGRTLRRYGLVGRYCAPVSYVSAGRFVVTNPSVVTAVQTVRAASFIRRYILVDRDYMPSTGSSAVTLLTYSSVVTLLRIRRPLRR